MATAPPVLLFALGSAVVSQNLWLLPECIVGAYLWMGLWTLALRYLVSVLGVRQSYSEIVSLLVPTSLCFALAWVPKVGPAIFTMMLAFWTYLALTRRLGMHAGAAVLAIALPVVICGLLGTSVSLILLLLASITTVFNH